MANIYTDTSLYSGDKLGMINQCLIAIGQRPLIAGTLIESLPIGSDGQIASDLISGVMRDVQRKGWYFNTDKNFIFSPDSFNFIVIPPNLLRIDVGNTANRGNIVIKSNKFYNRQTFSYIYNESITADAIWLIDYDMLPGEAYEYIAKKAARMFQQSVIPDSTLTQINIMAEEDAYIEFERVNFQYEDVNMCDYRVVNRNVNPHWGM